MAKRVHELAVYVSTTTAARPRAYGPTRRRRRAAREHRGTAGLRRDEDQVARRGARQALQLKTAKELVPPHPTLGDVDSPQALVDYQAAKRAHKLSLKSRAPRPARSKPR